VLDIEKVMAHVLHRSLEHSGNENEWQRLGRTIGNAIAPSAQIGIPTVSRPGNELVLVFAFRDAADDLFQSGQLDPLALESHRRSEFELDTRCHCSWGHWDEKRVMLPLNDLANQEVNSLQ
jgi:hypothetical protein